MHCLQIRAGLSYKLMDRGHTLGFFTKEEISIFTGFLLHAKNASLSFNSEKVKKQENNTVMKLFLYFYVRFYSTINSKRSFKHFIYCYGIRQVYRIIYKAIFNNLLLPVERTSVLS